MVLTELFLLLLYITLQGQQQLCNHLTTINLDHSPHHPSLNQSRKLHLQGSYLSCTPKKHTCGQFKKVLTLLPKHPSPPNQRHWSTKVRATVALFPSSFLLFSVLLLWSPTLHGYVIYATLALNLPRSSPRGSSRTRSGCSGSGCWLPSSRCQLCRVLQSYGTYTLPKHQQKLHRRFFSYHNRTHAVPVQLGTQVGNSMRYVSSLFL